VSRLAVVLDDAPTPLTWAPPADCPWCRAALVDPFYRDGELAGYHCPSCEWAVGLCRYCGWPAGRSCSTCRLHFRPVTAAEAAAIGDWSRRPDPVMPTA
jgi:hypothetical protein